ncbi:hypothetical protein LZ31DRAFT_124147 [Colletotrichum somersetense]|nr:hypothetical protein LZ31DRAFT_124147 [Colletotrichum somersetense]
MRSHVGRYVPTNQTYPPRPHISASPTHTEDMAGGDRTFTSASFTSICEPRPTLDRQDDVHTTINPTANEKGLNHDGNECVFPNLQVLSLTRNHLVEAKDRTENLRRQSFYTSATNTLFPTIPLNSINTGSSYLVHLVLQRHVESFNSSRPFGIHEPCQQSHLGPSTILLHTRAVVHVVRSIFRKIPQPVDSAGAHSVSTSPMAFINHPKLPGTNNIPDPII